MGADTEIAWCDHTFNPWMGCQRVSPGCENCYAEAFVSKRMKLPVWGPTAPRKVTSDANWKQPLKWNREAERTGKRARVFCASLADVFEDRAELKAPRARLWRLIGETPMLDWLLLTKRPQNVAHLAPLAALHAWDSGGPDTLVWPSNVWLGTTAEDQRRADERIPYLLEIKGPAVRFVSYEPALGPVDFSPWLAEDGYESNGPLLWVSSVPRLGWIIVGGESGPGARAFNPTWAREVITQAQGTGCAVFVKQMGDNVLNLADMPLSRKGGDPAEWPAELRVREWPRFH